MEEVGGRAFRKPDLNEAAAAADAAR